MSAILFKYVSIHSLGKFTTLETKFPTFCSHKRETLAIKEEINRKSDQISCWRTSGAWATLQGRGLGDVITVEGGESLYPNNYSGDTFTQSSRSKVNLISLFKYLFSYLFYYLLFWGNECELECPRDPRTASSWIQVFSRETSKRVSSSRPHKLYYKAMEILHHDDIIKVIVAVCFLLSNSNMKKQNETNKQNCANEFARYSRQTRFRQIFRQCYNLKHILSNTDQLETRSNVSSEFWLVERTVKRQQETRLFFKAKAELFYIFCWVLQRNFSKVCRHSFIIFAHLGFPI